MPFAPRPLHANKLLMLDIFLQTLPFFLIIGLGYGAARSAFFSDEATAWLTRFVFYFALSALLFRFSANLTFAEIFDIRFIAAYLWGTGFVYGLVLLVAFLRGASVAEAAVEGQCGVVGNVGFLGVPMLTLLMGEAAIGPVMLVLSVDLIVFGSLIVILLSGARGGSVGMGVLRDVGLGLVRNPMIMSIALGLVWSALRLPIPGVMNDFLTTLGGAATPGALFAIGASLASKSAERPFVAGWLSLSKLVLHPGAVAFSALYLFPVARFDAAVMICAASLPVAGNAYIFAQHYQVVPQRASAAILISTALAVFSVSLVIGWTRTLY